MFYHLLVQPLPVCCCGPFPVETVEGVEGWIQIQRLDHGGQCVHQHGNWDNYLLAPMLVRKEGVVGRGRRGRGDEMMTSGNRFRRMAKYCWDGKDGGSGHGLMGF